MNEQLICPSCMGDITREERFPSSFSCPCGTIDLTAIPKETDAEEWVGVIKKEDPMEVLIAAVEKELAEANAAIALMESPVVIGAGRAPFLGVLEE